jgi:hypothetical protein
VRTERICSLSSTQRIIFLGRMLSRFCRMPPCGGSRLVSQMGEPAGLQTHRSGGVQKMPRGPAYSARWNVMGRLLLEGRAEERKALLSLLRGISDPCRRVELPDPGCERGCVPSRLPRGYRGRRESPCCDYRDRCQEESRNLSHCVCRQESYAEGRDC